MFLDRKGQIFNLKVDTELSFQDWYSALKALIPTKDVPMFRLTIEEYFENDYSLINA